MYHIKVCSSPCIISGDYTGFDMNEPTSESGGKKVAVAQLKKKHKMYVMIPPM